MKIQPILEEIERAGEKIEFMKTGIPELDRDLDGGFIKEELIVLGGFTGLGKSYLAGQIMYGIAKQGFMCGYFSLEITNRMVVSRLLGQEADIKSIKILKGDLTLEEYNRKEKAVANLLGHKDFIDFHDVIYNFEVIIDTIKKNKYEFVVIDFIQNVIVKNMDEYSRLSYVALELQKLAKEQNCCVLILSQLSNSVARNIEGSQLEYKGSGSIATVCDLGFFITRDFELSPTLLTLGLRKNRRGTSGLKWDLNFSGEGGKIK